MEFIMMLIFWICAGCVLYIYGGYYLCLKLIVLVKRTNAELYEEYVPTVSVIVSAHNEEDVIDRRLVNLLKSDYPEDILEIIIASDGSTDKTVEKARKYERDNVVVLDFEQNRGRAAVQNDAVEAASGEIIVFSDAETEFDERFIRNIVNIMADFSVGCAVGNLIYKTKRTSVSASEGLYWKYEKALRKLESDIGIMSTATGACMVVRKKLWKKLALIDDCDFATPLDVILQGYKVVYAPGAVAYDVPVFSISGELKTRIRQTSRNFAGTVKRWGIAGLANHPFVSWGLLSHKILRWLAPFFIVSLFMSNLLLLEEGISYRLAISLQILFYSFAVIGIIAEAFRKRIPVASTVFSFFLANLGIGIGILKGIAGRAPASYE